MGEKPDRPAWVEEQSPGSIVGRMVKFVGKEGGFVTPEDGEAIGDDIAFFPLSARTKIGIVMSCAALCVS